MRNLAIASSVRGLSSISLSRLTRLSRRWTRLCNYAPALFPQCPPSLTACRVDQDLAALSAKGHFLKGSSATIGFTKVKDSCEKIQNIGARKDASGMKDEPDDKKSLNLLKDIVETTKEELDEVETIMKQWFGED